VGAAVVSAFRISYRDLAAMLADRGVAVDHTTLFRWVQALPRRWSGGSVGICDRAPAPGGVDETDIKVKGVWIDLDRTPNWSAPLRVDNFKRLF
jgi:transposase-like protein